MEIQTHVTQTSAEYYMESLKENRYEKYSNIFSTVFIVFGNLIAQTPDTLWSKIHNITIDIDEGKCVRQTSDGGYIMTGSCVPDGLVSHADVLLLKTDASGNILWTKTFDRGFFEEGLSVEQTSDGWSEPQEIDQGMSDSLS